MKKILLFLFIFLISFLSIPLKADSNQALHTSASSFILMDMDTEEVLLEKNSHQRYLTASICKILTAILVIEQGNLEDTIDFTKDMELQEGSRTFIQAGETVTVKDCLYGLLLRSGNDVAYSLALYLCDSIESFSEKMNELAQKLNMKQSVFHNPTGLDNQTKNYSSAYDMALLMKYCNQNAIFHKINSTKSYSFSSKQGIKHVFINKHRLIQNDSCYTGGKTGYTTLARRTLITTFEKSNLKLVVVTMQDSNDWEDHKRLFEYGESLYTKKNLLQKRIISMELFGTYYLGYVEQYPILYTRRQTKEENYALEILFYTEKKENCIGIIEVYQVDTLRRIDTYFIYEYDPLDTSNRTFYSLLGDEFK